MPKQDLTKREARYLYLKLIAQLEKDKRVRKRKGVGKLHNDIYISATAKLVKLLEDWHEPGSSRYLILKVEKR